MDQMKPPIEPTPIPAEPRDIRKAPRGLWPSQLKAYVDGVCCYDEPWVGPCQEQLAPGSDFCARHKKYRCGCGAQAIRGCGFASSLVCGHPLCGNPECRCPRH